MSRARPGGLTCRMPADLIRTHGSAPKMVSVIPLFVATRAEFVGGLIVVGFLAIVENCPAPSVAMRLSSVACDRARDYKESGAK